MKKVSTIVSLALALCLIFTACATTSNDQNQNNSEQNGVNNENKQVVQQTVNVVGLKGPTSIGMIKMIDEKALNSDSYKVDYQTVGAADLLTGKLINNEIQIAAVPTNLAAVLYNKTKGKIQYLAQNTLGVLYVVGKEDITSLADLEGKKVAISGKGLVPEYVMNFMLEKKGLTDKVVLDYLPDHATVAQAILAGDVDYAILPQPFVTKVTMNSENVKIVIDLNKVWEEASNGESVLSMGCLVVNKEFAANNKQFMKDFMTSYEESVNFVNANPKDASVLVEENEVITNAKLVEKAIPNCSIVYKSASDAKSEINAFLNILFESNNASIGGKLPGEDFYYED
ncbi:ABC transporter substrate-binding protein [Sedimentibacter sp. zth1]|uniref:ABC transporter substrate-binding protein n=1 Tax=Sedimentibacter sp. zth1 TaxID=2816908 RepID=UPI001A91FD70|nr:ABC transporter substrate-binding protein [Sedimentibacter sp. zth1]QSX05850.1 ABC transporter substrate-binding protein [Sedimentibacter sp. zth1]